MQTHLAVKTKVFCLQVSYGTKTRLGYVDLISGIVGYILRRGALTL